MNNWVIAALASCASLSLHAEGLSVPIHQVSASGVGTEVGSVKVTSSEYGLVFTPNLKGLEPGLHGFHIHANASCDPAPKEGKASPAEAAGGHWDPKKTGQHGTPWDDKGHQGDLPPLYVAADGSASQPVVAPRLKDLSQIKNHALMLHAGGDNHADHPAPLGGGGARVACGVIK
jgi:Cu-Zn family superoxide dismutase